MFRQLLTRALFLPAALFIPADTIHFWQAWAFLAVSVGIPFCLEIYFYYRDPQALARRLLRSEKIGAQKWIMSLARPLYIVILVLAGWDHQFGWTRKLSGPMPWWLTAAALALMLGYYVWFVAVLKANPFAASVIQVESGQTIAAVGPYRVIRHPMYLGMIMNWLAMPPALGSFAVWPAFLLVIPLLVSRLLNEEKFLAHQLPGYADYCRQTPWRLVPFVW